MATGGMTKMALASRGYSRNVIAIEASQFAGFADGTGKSAKRLAGVNDSAAASARHITSAISQYDLGC